MTASGFLRSRLGCIAVPLVALALSIAAPAQADVGERIILRCTHEESLSGFSQADYDRALKELSADTEEYSDCGSLIRQAQRQAAAAGRTGAAAPSGPATAIAATPSETQSLARAARVSPGSLRVGETSVRPGVIHNDSALSTLPSSLLATLALLLAGGLAFAGGALRNRFRERRPD